MNTEKQPFHQKRKRLRDSFGYAFQGIYSEFKEEQNIKIHLFIMVVVIILGIITKLQSWEWIVCIFLFAMVISLELMNTAIENAVDLAMPEKHPKAKIAKDVSAAAVLVSAIASAIIGLILFLPKIIH